jgi:hypothetical protein
MAEDVKVPGLGNLDKKYVIWGVVGGVGIGIVVYFRSKSKAQAAATADTSGNTGAVVTDPAGNTCAVLDANSGYCPGSPEDMAYQESVTGSYSGVGYSGGQYGGTGVSLAGLVTDPAGNQCTAVNPATGYCPGSPQDVQASGAGATGGGTGGVTTNTDWINEALGVVPGDQNAIRTALVDVLAGMTVTTAQKNIFLEAVGVIGQPPGGYPTPIKTSDTSAQPGGANNGGKYAANPPSGLRLVHNGKTGVQIQWSPVRGATKYNVHTPGRTPVDFTTTNTIANIGSLKPNTHYTVEVWADPTPTGGPHATLNFTTSKLWLSLTLPVAGG